MKILTYFIIILLSSCGYPDIDTIPDINNLKLTKEELIDLCKLSSDDKNKIQICIKEKQ